MKDPKVTELVKQFEKDVAALNRTWKKLQDNDVFIRLDIRGQSSYTDPKFIEVTQITQHVQYMKDPAL
jgi:hypothetical protein